MGTEILEKIAMEEVTQRAYKKEIEKIALSGSTILKGLGAAGLLGGAGYVGARFGDDIQNGTSIAGKAIMDKIKSIGNNPKPKNTPTTKSAPNLESGNLMDFHNKAQKSDQNTQYRDFDEINAGNTYDGTPTPQYKGVLDHEKLTVWPEPKELQDKAINAADNAQGDELLATLEKETRGDLNVNMKDLIAQALVDGQKELLEHQKEKDREAKVVSEGVKGIDAARMQSSIPSVGDNLKVDGPILGAYVNARR